MYYSYTIKSGTSSSPNQYEDPTAAYIRRKKTNRNLRISVFAVITFLVMFTVIMNIPFIPSSNPGCPEDKSVEESIMGYYFPCNVVCSINPLTTYIIQYPGNITFGVSATNSSNATAALSFDINNPCAATPLFIFSLVLSGGNLSNITRWDSNAQPTSADNQVIFSSHLSESANELLPGRITHFVFYPASTTPQAIIRGQDYSFNVEVGVSIFSTYGFGTTS